MCVLCILWSNSSSGKSLGLQFYDTCQCLHDLFPTSPLPPFFSSVGSPSLCVLLAWLVVTQLQLLMLVYLLHMFCYRNNLYRQDYWVAGYATLWRKVFAKYKSVQMVSFVYLSILLSATFCVNSCQKMWFDCVHTPRMYIVLCSQTHHQKVCVCTPVCV